jgi:hypothetical protein
MMATEKETASILRAVYDTPPEKLETMTRAEQDAIKATAQADVDALNALRGTNLVWSTDDKGRVNVGGVVHEKGKDGIWAIAKPVVEPTKPRPGEVVKEEAVGIKGEQK